MDEGLDSVLLIKNSKSLSANFTIGVVLFCVFFALHAFIALIKGNIGPESFLGGEKTDTDFSDTGSPEPSDNEIATEKSVDDVNFGPTKNEPDTSKTSIS